MEQVAFDEVARMSKDPFRTPRTQRVFIQIPVKVTGMLPEGAVFEELTKTHIVNASGALISLSRPVPPGGRLELVHVESGKRAACRVASVQRGDDGTLRLGVAFDQPMPFYWGIAFPPADWSTAARRQPPAQTAS